MSVLRFNVRMSRVEAEAVDAAVDVLNTFNIAFTLSRGGKHLAITVTPTGHKMIIASTPRSDNHRTYARQDAQRLARLVASEQRAR